MNRLHRPLRFHFLVAFNPQQVINAIHEAYGNKIYVSGSKYKGHSQGISIEIFDNVLSGKVEKDSASGNAFYFEVDKDNTTIEFLFLEDENKPEICTVNTQELRALMDEWIQKRQEFLKQKNSVL